jgi:hypothetical protein
LKVDVPAGEGTFDNPVRIKANQGRLFKITGGRTKGGASGTEKRSYLVNVEETGVVGLSWAKTGDTEAEDLFVVFGCPGPSKPKSPSVMQTIRPLLFMSRRILRSQ